MQGRGACSNVALQFAGSHLYPARAALPGAAAAAPGRWQGQQPKRGGKSSNRGIAPHLSTGDWNCPNKIEGRSRSGAGHGWALVRHLAAARKHLKTRIARKRSTLPVESLRNSLGKGREGARAGVAPVGSRCYPPQDRRPAVRRRRSAPPRPRRGPKRRFRGFHPAAALEADSTWKGPEPVRKTRRAVVCRGRGGAWG